MDLAKMKYNDVFFDFDGTLTDPKEGITNSIRYALTRYGIQESDERILVQFIGPPLRQSFNRFYGFSALQAEQAVGYYREYFAERGYCENEVYAGIPGILASLKGKGIGLHVATSKPAPYAERILDHFGLISYFRSITGSNFDGSMTDKGDLLNHALERHGASRGHSVMVGDRNYDVIGAAKAGLDSIGVAYGYGSRDELEKANPTFLCQTVEELGRLMLEQSGTAAN
jgi:phosphoglycolate phosphatase